MNPKDQSARLEKLEALGAVIATKRKEATDGRKATGIEAVWAVSEDSYLGMDDANRHEFKDAKWAKPNNITGPITSNGFIRDDARSTAFVRLTSRYVDAGTAKLAEILLPVDEKAFSFGPTPVPELVDDKNDTRPAVDASGQPLVRAPNPAEAAQQPAASAPVPAAPAGAPAAPGALSGAPQAPAAVPVPVTIADLAQQVTDEAEDKAKKAEKRIYDWMIECGYHAENRKVIHDAARLGVGVLKGPFPEVRKEQVMRKTDAGIVLEIREKVVPSAKWVDPWNLFPDPACGENIHHGDYIFERDYLAPKMLRALKKQKGYLPDQIDKVLKEGAGGKQAGGNEEGNPNDREQKNRFEVWYYYGTLSRDDMAVANAVGLENIPEDQTEVYAIITMVNDSILRATINPLESGRYPYDAMPWTRRAGSWCGVGVAEQVSMPQRMCNASTRALLNNAGNSCGPQIIIDREAIVPAQANDWTIRPNKIWFKEPGVVLDDVRKAFMAVEIPNVGDQMMKVIEYSFRLAEEASNIPLISQGQTGPTTPETLGATQLQNNNANTLLRSVGYSYDDHITEPKVHAFYEWLMLDPTVPDDEKGDFEINAHGSIAMVERAIQDQTLEQMGQMILNPAFGVDPAKWFAEWMKSKRLNPRLMEYTEDQKKKMAETPPADPPAVAVAKINAASREKIAGAEQGAQGGAEPPDMSVEVAKIKAAADHDRALIEQRTEMSAVAAKYADADKQRQHDLAVKQADIEMAKLQIQRDQQRQLDEVKSGLAKTTITEDTKKELAAQETQLALDLSDAGHAHDSVESAVDRDHEKSMAPPPSLIKDSMSTDETP